MKESDKNYEGLPLLFVGGAYHFLRSVCSYVHNPTGGYLNEETHLLRTFKKMRKMIGRSEVIRDIGLLGEVTFERYCTATF